MKASIEARGVEMRNKKTGAQVNVSISGPAFIGEEFNLALFLEFQFCRWLVKTGRKGRYRLTVKIDEVK